MSGGRKRASGAGSNSRRFGEIRNPDGTTAKVPAVKDACTYLCMETSTGEWPDRSFTTLLYDVTWLTEGSVFELEEMRPGHGMGSRRTLRVTSTRVRIQRHEGNYGQVQRWLLCEELSSIADRMNLTADELDGGA